MKWCRILLHHFILIPYLIMAYIRKTTPQFVEEAQRVHGEKFDYSEVEYVNTHTPVKIKCRQCGVVFLQEPVISLLRKINLSVLSAKSLGYNLRKIGFTQSFTKLYRLCSIKYQFYLLQVKLYLIIVNPRAITTVSQRIWYFKYYS